MSGLSSSPCDVTDARDAKEEPRRDQTALDRTLAASPSGARAAEEWCSMCRRWRQSGAARLADRTIEPGHPRRHPCRAFGKPARADAVPDSRTHRSRPDQVGRWGLEEAGQRERAVHGLVGQSVDGGAGRRTDISRSLKLRGGRLTSKIFRVCIAAAMQVPFNVSLPKACRHPRITWGPNRVGRLSLHQRLWRMGVSGCNGVGASVRDRLDAPDEKAAAARDHPGPTSSFCTLLRLKSWSIKQLHHAAKRPIIGTDPVLI